MKPINQYGGIRHIDMDRKLKAHLTVITSHHHQLPAEDPVSMEMRCSRELETTEQSYLRHTIVGDNWTKIDTGWLKEVSCLMIRNNEGSGWQRIPTPEQRAEVNARVLDISFDGVTPHLEVRTGEAHALYPIDLSKIFIRCRSGQAKITLMCFPK